MRIALVIERFEPGGGVENVAWQVAHGLAARDCEVRVFARRSDPAAGVPVERVRAPSGWQPARVLLFARRAAQRAPRSHYDVVHSFSRTTQQDVYRAGGGCHAAYLERSHGGPARLLRRLSPRHIALLWLEGRIFGDPSQLVLCNSRRVRDEIASRYPVPAERFAILPNGVDIDRFHPTRSTRAAARLREQVSPDARHVWLLVGSGARRKGIDTALRALERSRSGGVLWIAGRDDPAPLRELATRLEVGSRVHFLGQRDDLEAVYAAADALLLPTRYDPFANVCLEAAASGLPIATSRVNGASEVLGEAAIVVPRADDAAGFASALDRLADGDERRRLAAAARRVAEAHGWPAYVDALLELYAGVAARKRDRPAGRRGATCG